MSAHVPQTARQTLTRIIDGAAPWVAIGDFLDDWRRSDARTRQRMILEPLPATESEELLRWASLVAAAVDWLAWNAEPERIAPPAWVNDDEYILPRPWFLIPAGACVCTSWSIPRRRSSAATSTAAIGSSRESERHAHQPGRRYALAMRRVTGRPELLDGPLDHALLQGNMRDLARINSLLGGVALSRRALVALATGSHARASAGGVDWRRKTLRMLDVGTGAADIPDSLLAWTSKRGLKLHVEAVDERHEILDVARERVGARPELHLEHTAGDRLSYDDGAFDVVHASLVLHHLEPPAAVRLLSEMARTSSVGVIVNDLDRRRLGWLGAWAITRVLTRNRYTRHDGPLSVGRAYRPTEVAQLAVRAGLVEVARIRGFLGHRYAMAFVHVAAVESSDRDTQTPSAV